ncbi:MAG: M2 family metallopeptidase [Deltaproteobacteria bacterium]|nr:M2 family metallopeptidase [Deltaproteobacteria bacterium]
MKLRPGLMLLILCSMAVGCKKAEKLTCPESSTPAAPAAAAAACAPCPEPDVPVAMTLVPAPAADSAKQAELEARAFLFSFLDQRMRLDKLAQLAYWRATNASSKEESEREYAKKAELELAWKKLHADPERFAELKRLRESPELRDPLLKRQIELLYLAFLPNQLPEEMLKKQTDLINAVEKAFNNFRAQFEGGEASDNDLRKVLDEETDSARRQAAWEALKQIGPAVEAQVRELARLRNEGARTLGFDNFWVMMMTAQEMKPEDIVALFEQVAALTEEPYTTEKAKLDQTLAARYGVTVEQLRPWHCADPFCQSAPQTGEIDFDQFYKNPDPAAPDGSNLVALAEKFYAAAGMDVTPILAASDLYEKPAKEQHAYCMDADRLGDVRSLLNLKSNENWAETLLHELGHGVYFWYTDQTDLPYLLRESHAITTEAVAEMMGGLTKNAKWMQAMLGVPAEQAAAVADAAKVEAKLGQLIFARWSLVMLNFERELYRDPEQDLNALWWGFVEKFQKVTRPDGRNAPDWATKIHVATVPVYYHNYLMGEMFSAQLEEAIARDVYGGAAVHDVVFADKPEAGRFLIDKVFAAGHSIRWDELVRQSTGEALAPRAWIDALD